MGFVKILVLVLCLSLSGSFALAKNSVGNREPAAAGDSKSKKAKKSKKGKKAGAKAAKKSPAKKVKSAKQAKKKKKNSRPRSQNAAVSHAPQETDMPGSGGDIPAEYQDDLPPPNNGDLTE